MGELKAEEGMEGIWMAMRDPPPSFYIEPWVAEGSRVAGWSNFAIVAKLLLLYFPIAKSTKI